MVMIRLLPNTRRLIRKIIIPTNNSIKPNVLLLPAFFFLSMTESAIKKYLHKNGYKYNDKLIIYYLNLSFKVKSKNDIYGGFGKHLP